MLHMAELDTSRARPNLFSSAHDPITQLPFALRDVDGVESRSRLALRTAREMMDMRGEARKIQFKHVVSIKKERVLAK